MRPGASSSTGGVVSRRAEQPRSSRTTCRSGHGPARAGRGRTSRRRPGTTSSEHPSRASRRRGRHARRTQSTSAARGDRDRLHAFCAAGEPVFPKIKLVDGQGDVAFNAMDTEPRWRDPPPPGEYVATAWIPGNLLNEGLITRATSTSARSGSPKLRHHAGAHEAVSFHVQDPGEGDSARGDFSGPAARRRAAAARVDLA